VRSIEYLSRFRWEWKTVLFICTVYVLENSKGVKSINRKQCLGRNNISALREEAGTLAEDRDRMIKRYKEFYIEPYSTRKPQDQPLIDAHYMETGPPPPILPSEVRDAVKCLKRDEAPAEDNITAAIQQDRGEPFVKIFIKLLNKCIVDGKGPSCWK